jgi:hypothetical protein
VAKILLSLSELITAFLFRKEARPQEKGKEKIEQAKPAAAGERKHQNTNAEAGHRIRTNTKKDCKVKD